MESTLVFFVDAELVKGVRCFWAEQHWSSYSWVVFKIKFPEYGGGHCSRFAPTASLKHASDHSHLFKISPTLRHRRGVCGSKSHASAHWRSHLLGERGFLTNPQANSIKITEIKSKVYHTHTVNIKMRTNDADATTALPLHHQYDAGWGCEQQRAIWIIPSPPGNFWLWTKANDWPCCSLRTQTCSPHLLVSRELF